MIRENMGGVYVQRIIRTIMFVMAVVVIACGMAKAEGACYHCADCSNPSFCLYCGETGITVAKHRIEHYYDYNHDAIDLGDQHQFECIVCGELSIPESHNVDCDEPGVCVHCGTKDLKDGQYLVWHPDDAVRWFCDDNNRCAAECSLCEGIELYDHVVTCGNPNACALCGAEVSTTEITHDRSITWTDNMMHGFYCHSCKQDFSGSHEYDRNGECMVCGYIRPPILPGDPTGDGNVDIFDALAILQFAVGWETEVNQEAGDVNDDGKCDIIDALHILQYSVGWDVELK